MQMKAIFLGTSSGVPTPYRFLSCVCLYRDGRCWLFDCGEGAQIRARQARIRFSQVEAIFITHMHGDHITGLPGVLMSMEMEDRQAELTIVGPEGIRDYVMQSARMMKTGFSYPIRFKEPRGPATVWTSPENDYEVVTARLNHRVPAWGYAFIEKARPGRFNLEAARALGIPEGPLYARLVRGEAVTLPDGRHVGPEEVVGPPRPSRKFAYCTDTVPCAGALELGRDADLLVHEGTFAHDLEEMALAKTHSTVVHAARTAREAGARRLVITHFSPRYEDMAPLAREAREVFRETVLAEDLMEVEVPYPDEPLPPPPVSRRAAPRGDKARPRPRIESGPVPQAT